MKNTLSIILVFVLLIIGSLLYIYRDAIGNNYNTTTGEVKKEMVEVKGDVKETAGDIKEDITQGAQDLKN